MAEGRKGLLLLMEVTRAEAINRRRERSRQGVL
jgi:hypothetical protein